MAQSGFFAYINRMKYINRWGLMRNTTTENIQEHSHQVAVIAHLLAVTKKVMFNDGANGAVVDIIPERVAVKALYHDCSEIFTGDLPTPIKYANSKISTAYKEIEHRSLQNLLGELPEELQGEFEQYVCMKEVDDEEADAVEIYEAKLVKAADKISAYIKCIDETKAGNDEYKQAKRTIKKLIAEYKMPEVDYFVETMLPAVSYSLDELMK